MSPQPPACVECSAEVAPTQELCPRCGAPQSTGPAPQWRRALISAGITTAIAVLVLAIGYERMRSDAEAGAGTTGRAASVRPAPASDRAAASDTEKPLAAAQLAARPSP